MSPARLTASSTPAPVSYPEPTEADGDAMFASVVWFRTQPVGAFDQYAGKYVAILGEQIVDADTKQDELMQRIDGMGDALPPNRVVIQYVHGLDEPLRY